MMNVLIIYLFTCISCIVQPGIDGRKIYTNHDLSDYEASESYNKSIYRIKKGVDAHFRSKQYGRPSRNKNLFKLPVNEIKTSESAVPDNAIHSTLDHSKYKVSAMETAEHIIKVKSILDTKGLEPQERGNAINPKYRHVIEIIRRGDNIKGYTPTGIKHSIEKQHVDILKTDDPTDSEEFVETDEPIDSHAIAETDEFLDFQKFAETDDEPIDSEEFAGTDEPIDPEEFAGIDEPIDPEEFAETDEPIDFEEFAEPDEPIDCEQFTTIDYTDYEEFLESDYQEFKEAGGPMETEEFEDIDKHSDIEEPIETGENISLGESVDADGIADYDEFSETDYKEFAEADNPFDTEKFAETNGIDSEVFTNTDATDYEDFTEADSFTNTGNFPDTNKPKDTEEFVENNNSKEIGQTDSETLVDADRTVSVTFVEDSNNTRHEEMGVQHNSNSQESFSDEIEGSGEALSISQNDTSKSGRLLGIFLQQNETSPKCTTPKGEPGHCRGIRSCLLSDALNNFNVFLQHLCLIRGALVAVCCPDNPVIEISNDEENVTEIMPEEIQQPLEGCGLNTKTRIVGGSISAPHEWTWMVALMKRNRFYCGGVIINNWYVLTAAHCVLGTDMKDLSVRLGEYDFKENSRHREDISVSEIKRHAQFVTLTFQHDIALLKLRRSIKYSKFVGSICIPDQKSRDYVDVKGTVVGWGTVSFGGSASPILRQVTIPVWKNEDCDRTYLLENISDSFMCAGSPEKGEDACQGDSGGPLMALNDKGRWEVIGIVSWGRRCGDPTYPGVYTRVTTYLDWIQQNAN